VLVLSADKETAATEMSDADVIDQALQLIDRSNPYEPRIVSGLPAKEFIFPGGLPSMLR
jgi:hypothetical protein